MIRHTVAFRLKHAAGSFAERDFLAATRRLGDIEGVTQFECLRQIGKKNDFHFGLSMVFASKQAYADYDAHVDHVAFVKSRWIPEVAEFLEIDYVPLAEDPSLSGAGR